MAHKCSLCGERKARRHCLARREDICTVCCGGKREVEIDCPSNCSYLRSGREYETTRRSLEREMDPPVSGLWDRDFLQAHTPIFSAMNTLILMVRGEYPELVDADVRAVLESLKKTYQTEEKGIFYDSRPDSLLQQKLYRPLKDFLENPTGSEKPNRPNLPTGETISCLDVMLDVLESYRFPRPKSRAFLDSLEESVKTNQLPPESSSLILP